MADLPATTNNSALGNTRANPVVQLIRADQMQKMVAERLGKRAGQFTTSLISLVNSSPQIAQCTPITVIQAALTAASMDLPINQNLGVAYIVPYRNHGKMEAQFQMGWKGFVQLAQRSGKFKTINTTEVREGELTGRDRMTGELKFQWDDDDEERGKLPVIGYLAYFELLNGFSKSLYMTRAEIDAHATRYSQAYKSSKGNSSGGGFRTPWQTDFDLMAQKTALKLLLSKFAPLSTEMQEAVNADQSVNDGQHRTYVDHDDMASVGADDDARSDILGANGAAPTAPPATDDDSQDGGEDQGQPAATPAPAAPEAKPAAKPAAKKSVKEMAKERGWTKGEGAGDQQQTLTETEPAQ